LSIQTRGPYRNGQHSRGQVLLAATVVVAEHGYAAGSLRKIAEQAAMTEPGLLRLFGSKEGLLLAVLEYWRPKLELVDDGGGNGLASLRRIAVKLASNHDLDEARRLFTVISVEAHGTSHPARSFVLEWNAGRLGAVTTALATASANGEIRPLTNTQVAHSTVDQSRRGGCHTL
jgi:AcrR family transcriptional regulator